MLYIYRLILREKQTIKALQLGKIFAGPSKGGNIVLVQSPNTPLEGIP